MNKGVADTASHVIDLSDISQTMLLTLYMRYKESCREGGLIRDDLYGEIVEQIDYDFSQWDGQEDLQLFVAARTRHFDEIISEFVENHSDGCVVSIASGLGIAFSHARNTDIQWYDIDLPPVIKLRKHFFGNTANLHFIESSAWDFEWMDPIQRGRPTLIIIEGLLLYFEESEVRELILKIIDTLDVSEIVFDSISQTVLDFEIQRGIDYLDYQKTPFVWAIEDIYDVEKWSSRIKVDKVLPQTDLFGNRMPDHTRYLLETNPLLRDLYRVSRLKII